MDNQASAKDKYLEESAILKEKYTLSEKLRIKKEIELEETIENNSSQKFHEVYKIR